MEEKNLEEKFLVYFGEGGEIESFFSPGRVNLIGEHIDYNGGFVFPAALTIGINAAARKRKDTIVKLRSLDMDNETVINLNDEIVFREENGWGNYPVGMLSILKQNGYSLSGFEVLYSGSLPHGAGLSSSASLEVLTAYIALRFSGMQSIDKVSIARLAQKAENEFIGVNCGIMDQFTVAMGKKDYAILLDCETLKYQYVPFQAGEYALVIMNTNKRRELADSKYNERRQECEAAFKIIHQQRAIKNLCEASPEEVDSLIADETLKKRARHVVSENTRVLDSVAALEKGDIEIFGKLMSASHASLRDDYEVTGTELDTLVEEALKTEGCIGARMTGAGFGGCAIALVKKDRIEIFKQKVSDAYTKKTGLVPSFYKSAIGDGVKEVRSRLSAGKAGKSEV